MERKYYRQYENYEKIVPRPEDFPVLEHIDGSVARQLQRNDSMPEAKQEAAAVVHKPAEGSGITGFLNGLKVDDILLVAVIVMMLMEEERDDVTLTILILLFLSEYLF